MDPLSIQLGRRIKSLRQRGRATQEQLAERAHISVSFLSMIEGGRRLPHLKTVASLSEALGVNLSELFHFDARA
jgi:transcriptional regulator with XRE-family HTH domain